MITTVTTSTITTVTTVTTVMVMGFAAGISIVALASLIIFLVTKELAGAGALVPLWNDTNGWGNPDSRSDRNPFGEHGERMRIFRKFHTSAREFRAALLERMPALQDTHPVTKMEGANSRVAKFLNICIWPLVMAFTVFVMVKLAEVLA